MLFMLCGLKTGITNMYILLQEQNQVEKELHIRTKTKTWSNKWKWSEESLKFFNKTETNTEGFK